MTHPNFVSSRASWLALVFMTGIASSVVAAPIALQNATATFSQTFTDPTVFTVDQAIDGIETPLNGWAISEGLVANFSNPTGSQIAVFETVSDLNTVSGTPIEFTLKSLLGGSHLIGRFRLSATTDDRSTFADGLAGGGDVTANWTVLTPNSISSAAGISFTILADSSLLASSPSANTDTYTVGVQTDLQNITGFRLEVLEDSSLPVLGPGLAPANGNFVLTEFSVNATLAPVPEAGSWVMLLTGLGLIGVTLRSRPIRAQ